MEEYKKINNFLSRPTIVKCISFNNNDIKELSMDSNPIYTQGSESFKNNADIFKFIYNTLYIDITNVTNVSPLSFLKTKTNILSFIDDDTKKFNQIKEVLGEKKSSVYKYIYIKNWLNIINKLINDPESGNIKVVLDILLKHHMNVYTYYLKIGNKLLDILENKNNSNFQSVLNNLLQKKVKNNILTYIKIRNNDPVVYNRKRFEVRLNDKKHQMLIKYNDDNESYDKDKSISPPKIYNHEYAFGPFTNVFVPCLSNKEIAERMTDISDILKSGKSIFMFGYGASGAGKTSSLIYFNKGQNQELKDGILIHLCHIMRTKGYNSVEVKFKEFFKEKNKNMVTIIEQPKKSNKNILKFVYNNGFKLTEEYNHKITHKYRVDDNEFQKFEKDSPLGELMSYLVDKDRFVKATTNNPNSSRSHVLVYIKFIGENNNPLLILGDFAGVENSFNCEDDKVVEKFINIKVDNGTEPFYTQFPEEGVTREEIKIDGGLDDTQKNIVENSGAMSPVLIKKFLEDNFSSGKKPYFKDYEAKFFEKTFTLNPNDFNVSINKIKKDIDEIVKKSKDIKFLERKNFEDAKVKENPFYKLNNFSLKVGDTVNKDKILSIIKIIQYIIVKNTSKSKYATEVCKIRRDEGNMINESLKDVNNVIKLILKEKNKDSVDISPEFIDNCLPMYCKKDNCFSLGGNNENVGSIIFDNIKSEFEIRNYKDLNELIIGIFCVFNVSLNANNPPPIPYIDINDLLQTINNFGDVTIDDFKILRDKMFDLKLKLNNYIDKIPDLNKEINDDSLFFELKKLKSGEYIQKSIGSYEKSKNFADFVLKCKNFLEKVEKSNSASAIGTLQTVDTLSKYNTINVICDATKIGEEVYAFKGDIACGKK